MIEQLKKIHFTTSSCFDNKKVAINIPLYNRPEFFSKLVLSMNSCEELEEIPIFIFNDGGYKSKLQENIEIIKKIKFKNKFLIKRNTNFGCEKNIMSSLDIVFEELGFDYVFLIEDDLILSKNYFKFCFDSFKKIKNEIDEKIGIFQGHSLCFLDSEEKKKKANLFENSGDLHHWGILMSKEAYTAIKQTLEQYYKIIYSLPNDGRANINIINNKIAINNIFDFIIENSKSQFPEKIKNDYYKKQNSHSTLGWDGAFLLALISSGYTRYNSVVNRLKNVGIYGDHFSPVDFENMNLNKIALDEV